MWFKLVVDIYRRWDKYPAMEIKNELALTDMAASILRPLIKVLVRHGFMHSELTELVRRTYVEVAYDSFALENKKMTYSRAALLTGLSRKEVVRLYSELTSSRSLPTKPAQSLQHQAMRLVHGWLSDSNYIDANQNPIEIPTDGAGASFSALARQHCADTPPDLILAELNRLGITSESNHAVKLLHKGYVPQQDELEKIRVMSVCVSDLFNTAAHNSQAGTQDIRFQRQLVYSGIEETLARRFHEAGSAKAMALFDMLNEFLSSGKDQTDSVLRKSGKRVGLGIYYFEGPNAVKSVKMTSEEHA